MCSWGGHCRFFGLLLLFAFLWNDRSYEEGLDYPLISASVGMSLGGGTPSSVFKAQAKH
jgi:hypothetical protein